MSESVNNLTLGQVMRRPRWIAALFLAVAVAAGFAALGQWQLGSAIQLQAEKEADSELAVHLEDLTEPGLPVGDAAAGRVVVVEGRMTPNDFLVVGQRMNGGELGYWVVGHVVTSGVPAANLAVAVGWSADAVTAQAIAQSLNDQAEPTSQAIEGRYMPAEEPEIPKPSQSPKRLNTMSVAQQVNMWSSVEAATYSGFLVSHEPAQGLEKIDSVPPLPRETVNWLNLFYAIEWVVFAGFALYFWYRLAKDAWQKELEAEAEAESSIE